MIEWIDQVAELVFRFAAGVFVFMFFVGPIAWVFIDTLLDWFDGFPGDDEEDFR